MGRPEGSRAEATGVSSPCWIDAIGQPRFDWWKIVHQDQYWWDRLGRAHPIEDMDADYRSNCCGFLEANHARKLHRFAVEVISHTLDSGLLQGEQARLAAEEQFSEIVWMLPHEWMRQTPLYKALG